VKVRELVVSGVVAGLLAGGVVTAASLVTTQAAAGTASALVPITPCRLADTRGGGANVGLRSTPLGSTETHTFMVWGTNGNCTIPTTATGVAANVTAIGATAGTYLTVFPSDVARPLTSNLNPSPGSPPTPNQVTVALSVAGALSVYNDAGTLDLIIDLVGYYTPSGSGTPGPVGPTGATGATGATGPSGQGLTPARRALTTLDNTSNPGTDTSIAIGVDGNPVISYRASGTDDLRVAKCTNPACTTSTLTTLDSINDTGADTSIAIGVDGNPVISYRYVTAGDLRVAKCTNQACTASTLATVDSGPIGTGFTGLDTSIAIGVDGNPVISYRDSSAGDLRVAKCTNPACTASTLTTLDDGAPTGLDTSIAIGVDGNPVISYRDDVLDDLWVAKCTNPACTGFSLSAVDSLNSTGFDTSIAIGVDGNPVISYRAFTAGDLRVAKCTNPSCSTSTLTTVDQTAASTGSATSIAIGVDGNPVISYRNFTAGDLRVAKCADPACTTSALTTVDSTNNTGAFTSIAIGIDGNPVISYRDETAPSLRVAACDNWFCAVLRTRSKP